MKKEIKTIKQKLFENMEKINPGYKQPVKDDNFLVWLLFKDNDAKQIDSASSFTEANRLKRELQDGVSQIGAKVIITTKDGSRLNEASESDTYFDTMGAAVDYAVKKAVDLGYDVDKEDLWQQLGTGGVGYGESRKAAITLYKDGVEQKKALIILLYRLESGRYELTTYIN